MMAFRPENFTMPTQHMGLLPQADGSAFGRFGRNITDAIRDNRDARMRQEQLGLQERQFAEDRAQSRRRLGLEEQREERFAARDARREGREQRDFDAKMQLHEDEVTRQKRFESEALYAKYWKARESGDPAAVEAVFQEMERRGLKVDRALFPKKPPQAQVQPSAAGEDPTLGGTLQPDDAESPQRVDFDADAPSEAPKEDFDADAYLAEQKKPPKEDVDADDVLAGGDGTPREYAQPVDFDADQPEAPSDGPAPFLSRYMGQLPTEKVELKEDTPETLSARADVAALGPGYGARGYRPLVDAQAPEMPSGAGIRVYDEEGNVVISDDMPHGYALKHQGYAVASALKSFHDLAASPEEKAAAKEALEFGLNLVGQMPTTDIIDAATKHYEFKLSEHGKLVRAKIAAEGHARSGGGGGGGPGSSYGGKALAQVADDERNDLKLFGEQSGLKGKWSLAQQELEQAAAFARSGSGAQQRQALRELIKSMSGATVSDRERADYWNSAGLEDSVINEWNRLFDEGKISDDLIKQIAGIIDAKVANGRRKLKQVGDAAASWSKTGPWASRLSPEENDLRSRRARSFFTNDWSWVNDWERANKASDSGSGGGEKAPKKKPAATADIPVEDL